MCFIVSTRVAGAETRHSHSGVVSGDPTEAEQSEEAEKGLLLLYKAIPVLLYKIPGEQVTSEAA